MGASLKFWTSGRSVGGAMLAGGCEADGGVLGVLGVLGLLGDSILLSLHPLSILKDNAKARIKHIHRILFFMIFPLSNCRVDLIRLCR